MSQAPHLTRRQLLEFFGSASLASALGGTQLLTTSCSTIEQPLKVDLKSVLGFEPIAPTNRDELVLPEGFQWSTLITWKDPINSRGELFGYNNDHIAFRALNADGSDGVMMVNHEYPNPIFTRENPHKPTRLDIVGEQKALGISLLRVRKNAEGRWQVVPHDPLNRRIDGTTPIPFSKDVRILGSRTAIGTHSNCAGGYTPWGTFLTCEENYDQMYGETAYVNGRRIKQPSPTHVYGWDQYFDYPPEHYGWVVEVDPIKGTAKKLVSLGRFFHEAATVVPLQDGRVVVYSGDDSPNQCLYKFISSRPGSLEDGELYVAQLETGRWLSLNIDSNSILKKNFKSQLEIQIRTREAAHLIGGTKLDRPEDIERDPKTGAIIIALTNNKERKNYYGSLLKIIEKDGNYESFEFTPSTLLLGGSESGLACPDNLVFDPRGGLWICSDMAGLDMGKGPYQHFGNNSLFYLPLSGPAAGRVYRVASAPKDAEFTGPCFSPDGKTLFLSVQHPGETTVDLKQPTSRWPTGSTLPRPAVVTITGPGLERLTRKG